MKYLQTPAAADYFGVTEKTLKLWRLGTEQKQPILTEGIHWVRGTSRTVLFNIPLMEDWLAHHILKPELHQKAIKAHLQSLPSHQTCA
jgi:hypothetical protein